MQIRWKQIGGLALAIVGAVVPAVSQVENGVKAAMEARSGADKQAAALELVKSSVALVEQLSDKDLVNDPEVEGATRAVIDAVVHLQNVLVKKQAPVPEV